MEKVLILKSVPVLLFVFLQIAVLEQLKMEDLQQWLQLQVPDDKQYRRLTVQVYGVDFTVLVISLWISIYSSN